MTGEELEKEYKRIMEVLYKFKKTAYFPEVTVGDPVFSAKSKIGGLPFLRDKNDWPVCPNCKNRMQFFMQLDMTALSEKKSNGITQLFYCVNKDPHCEIDSEAFFHFAKSVCCRLVEPEGDSAIVEYDTDKLYEERVISSWSAKDDYPYGEEFEDLGIGLYFEDDIHELMEERKEGLPLAGDKLFGWPHWVQGVEYPADRNTNNIMNLLFQLDSEVNLPFMFGDAGIGHFCQSPDNAEELSFGWACG